jgi:hypothetical protein
VGRDDQWEANCQSLLAFKREHGHCKVQARDGKLGKWVSHLRKHYKNGTMKPEREARLEAAGFIWNGQSRSGAVVEDSDNDNDLDSANGSSEEENDISESHGSDQARGSRRSVMRSARKPSAVNDHETEETNKRESLKLDSDSHDDNV